MKVNKFSRRWRLNSFVLATSVFLTIAGCGGGAKVSSPFSAQQQTAQENTPSADNSAEPAVAPATESTNAPSNTSETTPVVVTSPANDSPANDSQDPPVSVATEEEPPSQTVQQAQPVSPPVNDEPVEQPAAAANNESTQPQQPPPPQQPSTTLRNATPADITDLVLVTGQSNALGADTLFDPALDGSDDRTFAWTENGWQVADLHQIWDLGWFPRGDLVNGPSNNLSLHFGKQVTSADSTRVVGFILATAPGQPISHWQADGEFFNSVRNKVSQAINELPSKARVDGILWHQGESDGRDDPAYGAALYSLIDAFRSESWYGANLPFICGETASLPVNAQLNRLNSDNDPNTACIAAEGLDTRSDNVHFSASALRIMGRRYADQYLAMTR